MVGAEPAPDRQLLIAGLLLLLAAANSCAQSPEKGSAVVSSIPAGRVRIGVYQNFPLSESLTFAAVSINGMLAGYATAGNGLLNVMSRRGTIRSPRRAGPDRAACSIRLVCLPSAPYNL
jgi:hypothetical protein